MITWESYFERIVILQVQFETARKALSGFANHKEILEGYAAEELSELRKMIHEGAKCKGIDPKSTWAYNEDAVEKYLEAAKNATIGTLGDAGKRLRQYEYILRVTVFESFLKEVHRTILMSAPSLLKADKQIPLGKLVAKSRDEVIRDEIEREVQALDRESTKKKSEYFLKRLGISWFAGAIVPILTDVICLRNEMLHENPEQMPDDGSLVMLNLVTTAVPLATIAQAALLYPDAFILPKHLKEEDARKFLPSEGATNSVSPEPDA